MKHTITLLFLFVATLNFAQTRGEIYSVEKKLDLTPEGVWDFFQKNKGTEASTTDIENYIRGIRLGLEAYKITYYTPDYDDTMIKATGLVMFPKTDKKLSTVVYCRTTTDDRDNSPSNLSELVKIGFVFPLTYALSEYIVIAPDNLGMGDGDGTNYYADAKTTTTSIQDMIKAANTFLDNRQMERYDEYFISGYSLGAHGGMAVLRQTTQDKTYKFKHAYFGGGPYDLTNSTFKTGILDKKYYPQTWIIANFGWVCNKMGYSLLNEGETWKDVINPKYYPDFEKSILNDEWGIFWAPFEWRTLFTADGIRRIEQENQVLIDCLSASDVHDWYNKTPTTMMTAWFDMHIPAINATVAKKTQRGYYPWWSLDKYQINTVDSGPFEHITGFVPWILASTYKFNTLRKGGFFNLRAESIYRAQENAINNQRSTIRPIMLMDGEEVNMTLKTIANPKHESPTQTYKPENAPAGVYMASANVNGKDIVFPYVVEEAVALESTEILSSIDKNQYQINLRGLTDKILSIDFYNGNNVVKSIPVVEGKYDYNFDASDLSGGEKIEVVTSNMMFTTDFKADLNSSSHIKLLEKEGYVSVESNSTHLGSVQVFNTSGQLVYERRNINKATHQVPSQNNVGLKIFVVIDVEGHVHTMKSK